MPERVRGQHGQLGAVQGGVRAQERATVGGVVVVGGRGDHAAVGAEVRGAAELARRRRVAHHRQRVQDEGVVGEDVGRAGHRALAHLARRGGEQAGGVDLERLAGAAPRVGVEGEVAQVVLPLGDRARRLAAPAGEHQVLGLRDDLRVELLQPVGHGVGEGLQLGHAVVRVDDARGRPLDVGHLVGGGLRGDGHGGHSGHGGRGQGGQDALGHGFPSSLLWIGSRCSGDQPTNPAPSVPRNRGGERRGANSRKDLSSERRIVSPPHHSSRRVTRAGVAPGPEKGEAASPCGKRLRGENRVSLPSSPRPARACAGRGRCTWPRGGPGGRCASAPGCARTTRRCGRR